MTYRKYTKNTSKEGVVEKVNPIDSIANRLANIFIESLKEEKLPWDRGFTSSLSPFNPTSGTVYAGISKILLLLEMQKKEYSDPRFLTYKQAQDLGGHAKKGESAIRLIRYQPKDVVRRDKETNEIVRDENGEPIKDRVFMPLPYCVFNVAQLENIKLPELEAGEQTWEPSERIDSIVKNSGAIIESSRACQAARYSSVQDKIQMPERDQFTSQDNYYSTLLHELGHWTGHESRLNRDLSGSFGSESYAREELKAEIGSALMCTKFGLEHDLSNNKAYIQAWIKTLQDNPREILKAANDADKISNYVMQYDVVKDKKPEALVENPKTINVKAEDKLIAAEKIKEITNHTEDSKYQSLYNEGKQQGYYQKLDFDTFKMIAKNVKLPDVVPNNVENGWNAHQAISFFAQDAKAFNLVKNHVTSEMPPIVYLHWSESGHIHKAFAQNNRFMLLEDANKFLASENAAADPELGYDKTKISIVQFRKDPSTGKNLQESYQMRYDVGADDIDIMTHLEKSLREDLNLKPSELIPEDYAKKANKTAKAWIKNVLPNWQSWAQGKNPSIDKKKLAALDEALATHKKSHELER